MSAQAPIRRLTAPDIKSRKSTAGGGAPIVSLTAYVSSMAALVDPHVDFILVGDSLGMVVHGLDLTVPVPLDLMILHGKAVMRGSSRALVVVDMPFGTYEEGPAVAFRNAVQVMKETGCGAVKLEGGVTMAPTIRFLVERGIPVMAHIGLTPQHVNTFGGFKAQGRRREQWAALEADARAVTEAGAFAVVLEAMPAELGRQDHGGHRNSNDRHRRIGWLRRPDPRHRRHARHVCARAEVREKIRPGWRRDFGRGVGLCQRGPRAVVSRAGTYLCGVREPDPAARSSTSAEKTGPRPESGRV